MGKKKKKRFSEKKTKTIEDESFRNKKIKKLFTILPFVIFLVLALIYFAPFLSGSKMMYGSDWLLGGYVQRVWSANYILEHKEIPMWLPHLFSGSPTVAGFFGDLISPHTLLYLIFPVHIVRTYLYILYIFLAGIGLYLLLKELKLGIFPSTVAAVCYMFSGSLISTTYAGHLARAISVALLPLMLLFMLKGVKRKRFFYFVFLAGIAALSFLGGHFQMTYYSMGLTTFFFIFLIFGERKTLKIKGTLKIVALFVMSVIILGMIVSISFLPVYNNLDSGARGQTKGYEYTTSWSMPTAELIDLFIPEFSGIKTNYWGSNYFKLHNEYFGVLPLLLLMIGVFFCFRDRNVKFFFFIGVVAMLLALGKNTPLFKLAYYIVPGIKKFRAPSLIFFIMTFSVILIGAFGLNRILEKKEIKKIILACLLFMGAYSIFALIAVVGKEGVISFIMSHFSYLGVSQNAAKLKAFTANYPLFIKGIGRALTIVILSIIPILIFLKLRMKAVFLVAGLLIILLFDQWSIGKRYLITNQHPSDYYGKDEVVSFLEGQDKSIYRVFPLQYQRSNDGILILNDIQSLGGYHPNPLRRYQELIGAGESVMFSPVNLVRFPKTINMLNGKFIIGFQLPSDTLQFDERTRASIREWRNFYSGFTPVHQGMYSIYENKNFLDRAFFVEKFIVLEDEQALLRFLLNDAFDPLETVLLEEKPDIPYTDTIIGGSTVSIVSYSANRIEIKVNAKNRGFLVLSENYYPRWKAYVDGKKEKVYRADYTLRAVPLNAGEHSVVFAYEDVSYSIGKTLCILGLIILLYSFVFQFVVRKKQTTAHLPAEQGRST